MTPLATTGPTLSSTSLLGAVVVRPEGARREPLHLVDGRVAGGAGPGAAAIDLAGHLIFPWDEWLRVRELLELVPWTRIAEVERPSPGQAAHHTPGGTDER